MRLIWATRGRNWGFRFLENGGLADPLPEFETAFEALGSDHSTSRRDQGKLAVRFPDPMGRTDAAGRVIPHEMVIFDPPPDLQTVEDVLAEVWPHVADRFDELWDAPRQ